MISINRIESAISTAIYKEFGDGYPIYKETVDQDLEAPAFSIVSLEPSIDQKLGNRYLRSFPFVVHYFPSGENEQEECNDAAERLMDCLELISVDNSDRQNESNDLVRGNNINTAISDGVLSFMVTYYVSVYKQEETGPIMESSNLNQHVTNEDK